MSINELDFVITTLGERRIQSAMSGVQFVDDDDQALYHSDPKKILST